VLDAVTLEDRGIPTVTVVTSHFSFAARAQAAMLQLPDLSLVEIAHRYNFETAEEKAEYVGKSLPSVIAELTVGGPRLSAE